LFIIHIHASNRNMINNRMLWPITNYFTRILHAIRYTDDSQKGLQQLTDNLNKINTEFGKKINVKKDVSEFHNA